MLKIQGFMLSGSKPEMSLWNQDKMAKRSGSKHISGNFAERSLLP